MSLRGYRPGDFWRVCDVCGLDVRASMSRKRWDGLMVCNEDFETRHPQDFVRGRKDRQGVPDPRPVAPEVYLADFLTDSEGSHLSDSQGVSLRSGGPVDYGL